MPAQVSKTELAKSANRYKAQLAKIKDQASAYGERIMTTAVTIGSAAGAGYISAKYPGQWIGVDKELWIGGTFLLLGLTGLGGDKMSEAMLSAGNGVMAAWAFQMTKTKALAAG